MGARVIGIEAHGLGELVTRGGQIPAGDGFPRAVDEIVGGARRGRGGLRVDALCCFSADPSA